MVSLIVLIPLQKVSPFQRTSCGELAYLSRL